MNVVFFFSNGNTAFLKDGNQEPKLQKSWFLMYIKFLEESGIDPTKCEFNMPGNLKAKPFRTKDGWNWKML